MELHAGQAVVAPLAAGEVHRYRIPLRQGDLLRLTVDQRGIDLRAIFQDPAGATLLEADRVINDRGLELVMAVASTSGKYVLAVEGQEGGPGQYEIHMETVRPATDADRRSAEAYRLFREAEHLKDEEALTRRTEALETWRELGETALEGEALARLAQEHFVHNEWQPAADLFRQSAETFAKAGKTRWEAISRNNLGSSLLYLNETEEAVEQYHTALRLARLAGDPVNQALSFHGLAQAHQYQGDLQQALDNYGEALKRWPKDHPLKPLTLHQLGVLRARYLHDGRGGSQLFNQALAAWGQQADRYRASTWSQLGRLAYEQGQLENARQDFTQALKLRGDKDPCGSAVVLARLALVEGAHGDRTAAGARLDQALQIVSSQSCPRSEPTVRFLGADLAEKSREPARARDAYQRCEQLYSALGDRMGRAESLEGIARAARSLGDLPAAREASRKALDVVEGVRPTVLSEELRTSYFSGVQDWFDAHIGLLLEMGNADEAWATAERARARALGDLLAEAGAGLRKTASPDLIRKEQTLQHRLNALETQRLRASEKTKPETRRALQADIDAQVTALESLRGDLRRGSPLAQPPDSTTASLRQELLAEDTLLLEYRLAEPASTLWAVTQGGVTAFRLPSRREIEPEAREAASALQDPEGELSLEDLCALSRKLLAPVAASLDHYRRLAVVADGALELLPFAALPVPGPGDCARAPLLVDGHEIVSLPSATALLTQRRLLAGRKPAPGWLAVVADPLPAPGFNPLPGSALEAEAITSGLPAGKFVRATRSEASRNLVTSGRLARFRILHFATHGILNEAQPLLSALELSDGPLLAHEIYDLDLPAELVVLSACETQGGRDVPGEGLVSGLPRAFLYAGAARVLVSLWAVDDESTRELMVLFYRGLFDQGLPPALALQEAQRTLRRNGRLPYQWAGFVLLGDWRALPPFDHGSPDR